MAWFQNPKQSIPVFVEQEIFQKRFFIALSLLAISACLVAGTINIFFNQKFFFGLMVYIMGAFVSLNFGLYFVHKRVSTASVVMSVLLMVFMSLLLTGFSVSKNSVAWFVSIEFVVVFLVGRRLSLVLIPFFLLLMAASYFASPIVFGWSPDMPRIILGMTILSMAFTYGFLYFYLLLYERKDGLIDQARRQLRDEILETKKFKLAIENTSEHVVITDINGIILFANRGMSQITGFSVEEILGTKAGALWGGLMPKEFYQNMWRTIKIDKKPFIGTLRNKRKSGELYDVVLNISPVFDEQGKLNFFVAIERDVTKEKEIERMKANFLAVATHQLRTPLGSMRWILEAMIGGDFGRLRKDAKEAIGQIYDSDLHMLMLVNDLLDVSRIEEGRIKNDPEDVDIFEVVSGLIKEQGATATAKGVAVTFEKQGEKLVIHLDKTRIKESIANLLSNAIKYSPKDSVVTVFAGADGKNMTLSVADQGMGIPKEEQDKIFQKFYRSSTAVASGIEGSGLGLFIVKAYAEAWGGGVKFESEEGKGTVFTMQLPMRPSEGNEGGKV